MSAPKIDIMNSISSAVQDYLGFGARPLGGTSNAIEVVVWNDKPVNITSESLGTGDGTQDTFSLANQHVFEAEIRVAGTLKTEGTHYAISKPAGQIQFTPGNIPTAGQSVTATYSHGTGSGMATDVFLLSRRRQTFLSTGSANFTLAAAPSLVYEALVDGAEVEVASVTGNIVELADAPASEAVVVIIYEDETVSKQVLQGKSSGVEDPLGTGMSDDAQSTYIGIGGSVLVENEAVGTGDGANRVFSLANQCVIPSSLVVKVDGVEVTEIVADAIRGDIEFNEPPGNTLAITATYRRYRTHKIGALPAGSGRKVQLRAHAPTTTTLSVAEANLEVWAV